MFPGSNLLDDAFEAIDTVTIQYLQFGTRVTNAVGQFVTTYAPAVNVQASVQGVGRATYVQFGLDFQKNYISVFASIDATDLDRDMTGDRFILPDGRTYQVESETDWYGEDGGWQGGTGWVGPLICVRVDFA